GAGARTEYPCPTYQVETPPRRTHETSRKGAPDRRVADLPGARGPASPVPPAVPGGRGDGAGPGSAHPGGAALADGPRLRAERAVLGDVPGANHGRRRCSAAGSSANPCGYGPEPGGRCAPSRGRPTRADAGVSLPAAERALRHRHRDLPLGRREPARHLRVGTRRPPWIKRGRNIEYTK